MSFVKTKVVLNGCYGGFNLSEEAEKMLISLGIPEDFEIVTRLPNPEHLKKTYYVLRHDPILVRVIETLGEKSYIKGSYLQVHEVNGNVYRVTEYDGNEGIQTPESIRWVTA